MVKYKLMGRIAALIDKIVAEGGELVSTATIDVGEDVGESKVYIFDDFHKASNLIGPRRYHIVVTTSSPITTTRRYEMLGNGLRPGRGGYLLTKYQFEDPSDLEPVLTLMKVGWEDQNVSFITAFLLYRRVRRLRSRILESAH